MSNQINLIRTSFTDHNGTSYGYRGYDGYEQCYSNVFESPASEDDKEFFHQVWEDGNAQNLINTCREDETGVSIDGEFYDYETIKGWMEE